MSQPIDRAYSEGFYGPGPSSPPPLPKLTWDSGPPEQGMESWRYARRCDLATLSIPFVVALVHGSEGALASNDPWREDPKEKDREIVARAVGLAKLIQDAVDKARPRA